MGRGSTGDAVPTRRTHRTRRTRRRGERRGGNGRERGRGRGRARRAVRGGRASRRRAAESARGGWTVGVARGWDAREHPCARAPSRDAGWTKKLRRASRANDTIHRFRERSPELARRGVSRARNSARTRTSSTASTHTLPFSRPAKVRVSPSRSKLARAPLPRGSIACRIRPSRSQQQAATPDSGRDGRHGALP